MKNWAEFYNYDLQLKDYFSNLRTHDILLKEIIDNKPKSILEIGVGTGIMGIFLSWLGYKVTGIDNNEIIIQRARSLCKSLNGDVSYVVCDVFKLDEEFRQDEFDIIFSQGFFEHFKDEDINVLLRKQLSISRTILLSVPSVYYPRRDFGNERLLFKGNWQKILNKYNFDNHFIKYYGFFLPSKEDILKMFLNPIFLIKTLLGIIFDRSHILIKIKA